MEMDVDLFQLAMATAAFVVGGLHAYAQWKKTGKIDLDKTMELAEDVLPEVRKKVLEGVPESEALEHGVELIKKLRGRSRIAAPALRKVRQRLSRRLRELRED